MSAVSNDFNVFFTLAVSSTSGLLLLSPLFPFTSRIPPFLNCSSRQIQLQLKVAQDCIALFECKKLALPAAARAAPAPARTRARPKTEARRAGVRPRSEALCISAAV